MWLPAFTFHIAFKYSTEPTSAVPLLSGKGLKVPAVVQHDTRCHYSQRHCKWDIICLVCRRSVSFSIFQKQAASPKEPATLYKSHKRKQHRCDQHHTSTEVPTIRCLPLPLLTSSHSRTIKAVSAQKWDASRAVATALEEQRRRDHQTLR